MKLEAMMVVVLQISISCRVMGRTLIYAYWDSGLRRARER